MRIDEIRQLLRESGAGPDHEERVLRAWCQNLPMGTRRQPVEETFPLRLREALPSIIERLEGLARVRSEHPAGDGSERLLVELADGQTVESVLLPRDGVCVSTQVGCAVGCRFCMTGRDGLLHQLTAGEIVAQVVLARKRRPVKKVVFMGMGEPAHNLDNVLEAIELLGTAGGVAHKNLVFSTVGDRRAFERLPLGAVKPALALSLHTSDAALRARLLPKAPLIDPEELTERAEAYALATGYPIQYQWTLMEGVNDGDGELEGILRLLKGRYAVMNFILYNEADGDAFRRPDRQRASDMVHWLRSRGVYATLRDSAGQDVDGGCGQLRARAS